MSHLSQSINQVPNGHVSTYKKKKSQLALIGILACSFCGQFSNRHGSRTASISPQERSPQQTKRLLVLAPGSFVTITAAMYRTLALWAGTGVPWEWNKTPCAAGCSQAGVSSWPWRAGDVWGQCWRQLPGHGMLPLGNPWQEKVFLPWNREVNSRTGNSWSRSLSAGPLPGIVSQESKRLYYC